MAQDRTLQTTFANLMGATRFKASKQGKLWRAICPKCREAADSWSHCVTCHQLEVTEIGNEKKWLANIKAIVSKNKTATLAKNAASNLRHREYLDGGAYKSEGEEERSGGE